MDLDLSQYTSRQLLELHGRALHELNSRGMVRTLNSPIGDIAERIVWLARGGILEPNSTKSHDITTPEGQRIQVKARVMNRKVESFSVFRSMEFDTAIFLMFANGSYELSSARELQREEVEDASKESSHVNGLVAWSNRVSQFGVDVTAEMVAAYHRLDEAV